MFKSIAVYSQFEGRLIKKGKMEGACVYDESRLVVVAAAHYHTNS